MLKLKISNCILDSKKHLTELWSEACGLSALNKVVLIITLTGLLSLPQTIQYFAGKKITVSPQKIVTTSNGALQKNYINVTNSSDDMQYGVWLQVSIDAPDLVLPSDVYIEPVSISKDIYAQSRKLRLYADIMCQHVRDPKGHPAILCQFYGLKPRETKILKIQTNRSITFHNHILSFSDNPPPIEESGKGAFINFVAPEGFILENFKIESTCSTIGPNEDFQKTADLAAEGEAAYSAGKFEKALEAFNKAINLDPNSPCLWSNKAITLQELKRPKEALDAVNKAIKLQPDHKTSWLNKGNILKDMGRYNEALDTYKRAIELRHDAASWNNMGETLKEMGRLNDAIDALNKAVILEPNFNAAIYNLAQAYSQKGDKRNALSNLSKAIKRDKGYKRIAKKDKKFTLLWNDAEFKRMIK